MHKKYLKRQNKCIYKVLVIQFEKIKSKNIKTTNKESYLKYMYEHINQRVNIPDYLQMKFNLKYI